MYKIKSISKDIKELKIYWTDKCEILFFKIIKNIKVFKKNSLILLPPIPWDFKELDKYEIDYKNLWFIVNDLWALEYLFNKWAKKIYLWRILLYWLTRTFNNLIYLIDKLNKYNLKGIFINYDDFFNINMENLNFIKSKELKLWIFIQENLIAYSPRCHYLLTKKEKWDFDYIDCGMYCEKIKKENWILLWVKKKYIYDYKMLLIKNVDFSRIKEDKIKLVYIDYFIY
jgi:hypothetical protein